MKKVVIPIIMSVSLFTMAGCSHSENDINDTKHKSVTALYNEVKLDWSTNTFTHDGFTIDIPERWGYGILGRREKFVNYNPHDVEYKYIIETKTTYGGDVFEDGVFDELVHKEPESMSRFFEIKTVGLDIDSKVLVKDELIDDCYFKYDMNPDFDNFCYFKMAKNDINQLKQGYFNQINVKLKYDRHIDSSLTFALDEEKDGLNSIGIYSDVSISYNPDFVAG